LKIFLEFDLFANDVRNQSIPSVRSKKLFMHSFAISRIEIIVKNKFATNVVQCSNKTKKHFECMQIILNIIHHTIKIARNFGRVYTVQYTGK
jgi:hypothetical protein